MTSETLLRRLRALRAMTTANGCTEAEAMSAAAKAAEIMRDAGLTESDLEIGEASSPSKSKGRSVAADLWPIIAFCTNTASIVVIDDGSVSVTFVGREPGPEIAVYLREVCERAIKRELEIFKAGDYYRRRRTLKTRRRATDDFVLGMVLRLRRRLLELFSPIRSDAARARAVEALDTRYPDASKRKLRDRTIRNAEAAVEGFAAGGRVPLNHGMTESDAAAALTDGREQA
jgi:hypothetical protein